MLESINTSSSTEKSIIIRNIKSEIATHYSIAEENTDKPWGGYFRLSQSQIDKFLAEFFTNTPIPIWAKGLNFDPKILLVAPKKRLSWQYHARRGEFWRVIKGPVGAIISSDNKQTDTKRLEVNQTIEVKPTFRHRLVGLGSWGIVAEIWVHTDKANPSNEDDITRLEDDFGRD